MAAYYNEFNKDAAAWLRVLIQEGLIAHGYVDERSIEEVTPGDLRGFTQCHFFAGIGGWSLALRIAGVADNTPCWTGSPPCQPFSVAGLQLGMHDARHLAPVWLRLIDQCQPSKIFGEQVKAAIKPGWLDLLFGEMERAGYACGASVLPAGASEAPHLRDRLFFGAVRNVAHTDSERREGQRLQHQQRGEDIEVAGSGEAGSMDDAQPFGRDAGRHRDNGEHDGQQPGAAGQTGELADEQRDGSQGWLRGWQDSQRQTFGGQAGRGRAAGDLANAFDRSRIGRQQGPTVWQHEATAGAVQAVNPWASLKRQWDRCDWILCLDGNYRPIEPGTFPLANGVPARVGRLRGYGNAISPQITSEFIEAFNGACNDARRA